MESGNAVSQKEMFERLSPCDPDRPYVFVSYSSRDWQRVCADVYELQRRGYNIWIDEKNLDKRKDSWKKDALGAIRSWCCEFVLFYVSAASLTSEQCLTEMRETFSQETVDFHAGDPVQFICIDTEQIGDIQKARLFIKEAIRNDDGLSTAEKGRKSRALSVFLRDVFNGNNERVRIHPANDPDRRSDYYAEILRVLPAETKIRSKIKNGEGKTGDPPAPLPEEEVKEAAVPPEEEDKEDAVPPEEDKSRAEPGPSDPFVQLQENLLKQIEALESSPLTPRSDANLRKMYEAASANALEHGLDLTCAADYVWFLVRHRDYGAGLAEAEKLHRLPENRKGTDPLFRAKVLKSLAVLYTESGRKEEAEKLFVSILPRCRIWAAGSAPDPYRAEAAGIYHNLAILYDDTGRRDEAETLYREALGIRAELAAADPGRYNPDLAASCNNLANIYDNTGRRDEAEPLYREVLGIRRELAASDPGRYKPDLAASCNNLAILCRNTGRRDEAETLYREALVIRRELAASDPGRYSPALAWSCHNLANLFCDVGRGDEAGMLYREALGILRELAAADPGRYKPDLAAVYGSLAVLYDNTGRREEAEALYVNALNLYRELAAADPGRYNPELANTCRCLSVLYLRQGRFIKAADFRKEEAALRGRK